MTEGEMLFKYMKELCIRNLRDLMKYFGVFENTETNSNFIKDKLEGIVILIIYIFWPGFPFAVVNDIKIRLGHHYPIYNELHI